MTVFSALLAACAGEEDGTGGSSSTAGSGAGGDVTGGGGASGGGGEGAGAVGGQGGGTGGQGGQGGGTGGQGGQGGGTGGQGGQGGGTGGQGGGQGGGPNPADFPPETEPNGNLGNANALQDGTRGFQAELPSVNDVDVFSVDVPVGSSLSVIISDGLGGCPADAEVTVTIYDPANLEFATSTGLCPVLNGNSNPDLGSIVTGGTYYVRVSTVAPVSSYVVEIDVAEPVCGDMITQVGEECDDGNNVPADGCEVDCTETPVCGDSDVQTGEECDDGDTMSGDGCDSNCQLEGDYCPEAEPNETPASATPLTACIGGSGQIAVAGDQDYYSVVVPQGGSIRAEVVDILGSGCPAGFDSMLEIYSPAGALVISDDDDGNSACSLINPETDQAARNLPAGVYTVNVTEFGDNGTSLPYVALISASGPGCGDNINQDTEECEDGNVIAGDGCDATCNVEGNFVGEVEPNNTNANATIATGFDGGFGKITPIGDVDTFRVTVNVAGSSLRAETIGVNGTTCPGMTTTIRLYNAAGVELGSDTIDGVDSCSLINPAVDVFATNLAVGNYFVRVEEVGNNATTGAYKLLLDVNPPGCADFILQAGEECDDGNTTPGDGCDATCQLEGNFCSEVEANDSFGQATVINGCVGAGQIGFAGDIDFFRVNVVAPNSTLRAEITGTNGPTCTPNFDSVLRLYDSNMALLGNDDNDGDANCSLINPSTDAFATGLAVGTYYLRVSENGDDTASLPYFLTATVSAPGCGDGILQAGEQCDDGNQNDNDGCSNNCEFFTCQAGQTLVQLSAQGLPLAILDNATVTSTINVPTAGLVTRLATRIDLTHTYDGDVNLSLDAPNAAPVALASGLGGTGENYTGTIFSSTAANLISGGSPPFTGVFAPEASFSPILNTQAMGNWVLSVNDDAFGDTGSLTGYTLYLCVQP